MARLIIVEDNSELAFLIASAARARGHEPTAVGTGRAALQTLAGGASFDAAVVDLLLPDVGGGEVLHALKEAGIPAVAMSGVYRGEQHARHAVEQYGAVQFFEKPFDMRTLLHAVEAAAAAGGAQPALLIEDEEDDLAELEELTPLEEEDSRDEPLVGGEAVPELDDEPDTPTRPLDEAELAALAQTSAVEAAPPAASEEETADIEDDIPTRVVAPPMEIRLPEQRAVSAEEEVDHALEAIEAIDAPMSTVEAAAAAEAKGPPPLPRPARGPGGAVGMAHELAVRVSHRPPEEEDAEETVAADLPRAPGQPAEATRAAVRLAKEVEAALSAIDPSETFLAPGEIEALRSHAHSAASEPLDSSDGSLAAGEPALTEVSDTAEAALATGELEALGSDAHSAASDAMDSFDVDLATGVFEALGSGAPPTSIESSGAAGASLATGEPEPPPALTEAPETTEATLATGALEALGSEAPPAISESSDAAEAPSATTEASDAAPPPSGDPPATPSLEAALATPPAETPAPDAVLVPFGERGGVWQRPDHPTRKRPLPDWGEAGDLSQSSVPKLLNAFYESRHTGELKLKQDSVLKVVFVENGLPVYAASNLATERFGRFCVRRGAIAEVDLNRVAALAELEGIRTGESMVRLGLLTSDRRRELLEEQVRDIIWSTFSWNRGQYHLVPKKPNRQDLVKLFLFPGELILEGVARAHTLISLRQKMPAGRRLFPAPDPPYLQQDIPLTGPQLALLAATDGSKTVEDLLALTDLSEREALASLLSFELLGLVVERRLEDGKRERISFGL